MLLSYNNLVDLVAKGVIDSPIANINAASIDITLGNQVMIENKSKGQVVDLSSKQTLEMIPYNIDSGIILAPGDFILATTNETFNLPNCIAAEYKLKSSLARSGLQHLLAGWCDPGWFGSRLTLELKNVTSHHNLLLRPGMKIGQMVFFQCEEVPSDQSYASKGQYNKQESVVASKGLR